MVSRGISRNFCWGEGVNLKKVGWRGTPQKPVSFDPFVNCILAILVNFLHYVIFSFICLCFLFFWILFFFPFLFFSFFLGGGGLYPKCTSWWKIMILRLKHLLDGTNQTAKLKFSFQSVHPLCNEWWNICIITTFVLFSQFLFRWFVSKRKEEINYARKITCTDSLWQVERRPSQFWHSNQGKELSFFQPMHREEKHLYPV